jgi:hypothetical protein
MTAPASPDQLIDWTPISLRWEPTGPAIDWRRMGERRFVEPFFDQSIHAHQREVHRANRSTPAEALLALMAAQPESPPAGFIFHASHCGSTLVARMLAALPSNIVLSEPAILESVLRPAARAPPLAAAEQARLLGAVIGALGRRRQAEQQRCFVKFASRALSTLPLIRSAFPEVPWVFVYREPLEILGAYLRGASERLPPGVAAAGLLEGAPAALAEMRPEEFWIRVLAARFSDALRFYEPGKTLLLNHAQLPESVCDSMLGFFGMACTPHELEQIRASAAFNAKSPTQLFLSDSAGKRSAVPESARALMASMVMPHYLRLESIRLAQPRASAG